MFTKIMAYILIISVYGLLSLAVGWAVYEEYCVPKISFGNNLK